LRHAGLKACKPTCRASERPLLSQLLILDDDWGLEPLDAGARRDLYEILEERYGRRSTILTSQIPGDKWHAFIGEPTTS
jgi:DNA replication protein DnaC